MENLKCDVVEKKDCSIVLKIEVPSSEVLTETEKVYQEIQKVAKIPGFRVGKSPMDLVKKNYVEQAREKIVESLMNASVGEVLKTHNIDPIGYPTVEKVDFDFNKSFSFQVKAEYDPTFEVKDYEGIKITKDVKPVTDEMIAHQMEDMREKNAYLVESASEIVEAHHFVLIDYDVFMNDVIIPRLKAKNQLIEVSSQYNLAGFKDGLMGSKKGEEREIKTALPENYKDKELASKEVVFKIKINEIKEKKLSPVDDDLAKDFGFQNLEDMKASVKTYLENLEKKRQDSEIEKQIVEHLLAVNAFAVPESLVENRLNFLLNDVIEEYKKKGYEESAITETIKKNFEGFKSQAEKVVRLQYILAAVGKKENIEVSKDDIEQEKQRMLELYPNQKPKTEEFFATKEGEIIARLKQGKIYNFIVSKTV